MKANRAPLLLDDIDRHLLSDFQRDFPLTERPCAAVAARLGVDEAEVLRRLERLSGAGAVSRVGPVLRPKRVGASTLAAMAVPAERLAEVIEEIEGRTGIEVLDLPMLAEYHIDLGFPLQWT